MCFFYTFLFLRHGRGFYFNVIHFSFYAPPDNKKQNHLLYNKNAFLSVSDAFIFPRPGTQKKKINTLYKIYTLR